VKEQSTDWLPWLGLVIELGGKIDWLNALLLVTAAIGVLLVLVAQMRKGDGFDMRSMFAARSVVDSRDYWTVEPGRVFQTGAFVFTSWALVWVVTHDKLTEVFLFVYVALWAGSRAMNQVIASKFPVTPGTALPDAPATAPAVVTTTTTEIKQ
jgi:hypothetical protein